MTLTELLDKFSALSRREKWLLGMTLFVILFSAWYEFFYFPLMKVQENDKQELVTLKTQLATQQQRAVQLQNTLASDPNRNKKNQLSALKNQYQELHTQISLLDKKFVPPTLMAKLLNDLLKKNTDLTLIKLETLPVKQRQILYQHGLVLRFSGSYLATLNYLQSLETLPWNFIWDSIDYEVKEYPLAEISLRVYTLSLEENWLDM